ncbi:MAG: hypothetical protein ACJ79K_11245, partial [Gemmatimonadaceae bacterium]
HWPQGRGKPALVVVATEETKNDNPLEFELPKYLSDRLYVFRHEIAPPVIGKVPDALFTDPVNGDDFATAADARARYQRYLLERLAASHGFVAAAVAARDAVRAEPRRRVQARR